MDPQVMKLRLFLAFVVALALAPGSFSDATLDDTPAASEAHGGHKVTWLLGHARTGRNRWVTGAAVLVTPASGESRIYVTATDEKGSYFFDALPEGLYDVTITKSGLVPVTKDKIELRFPFRAVVEVVMEPEPGAAVPAAESEPAASGDETSLDGTIRAREGEPLDEVRIRLIRADGSVDPRDGMTGAEGRFAIPGLEPGAWRLEILGAGFLPIRVPVTLSGEATLTASLVEQPASYQPPPLDLIPPEMPIPPPPPHEPEPTTDAVAERSP
jgi:hypothetical protein